MGLLLILAAIIGGAGAYLNVPPTEFMPPTHVLRHFDTFNLIVHFDSGTNSDLDVLFEKCPHTDQATYLVNYHIIEGPFLRPNGYKYLNVVFLSDPFDFEDYSKIDYNFMFYDAVLFVVKQMETYANDDGDHFKVVRFWQVAGLQRSAIVLVFDLNDGKLYHCCYYCANSSGQLTQLSNGTALPDLESYFNRFKNFNGHTFDVAYVDFPPFFWCSWEGNPERCQPQGPEGYLLETFSKMYNFKYNLIKFEGDSTHGVWQEMVEEVHYQKVDWAIGGISVTVSRGNSTDFTRFIKTQGFSVLYVTDPTKWILIEDYLLSFFPILISLLIGLFCMVVGRLLGLDGRRGFLAYTHIAMMSVVEQSLPRVGRRTFGTASLKIVFVMWWLLAVCINMIYRSQLASSLIRPNTDEARNIDDLVEWDFDFQVNNVDWSVLKENFLKSSDKIYEKVLKRIKDDQEFCDAVADALDAKKAVIEEEVPMQYMIYKQCENLTPESRSKLMVLKENLFPESYHGWCMQMATPFVKEFSKTIGRLDDTGLLYHWYHLNSSHNLRQTGEDNSQSLTIPQILRSLLILGVGLICSLLLFVGEILLTKIKQLK